MNIATVECVVLDRRQAAVWIKRKHYKGMGGAGVVSWNAVATARSDAAEGKYTRWMTALAYLEDRQIDAEHIRESIALKTTTVERVLASTYMFSILGLSFGKNGTLIPENGDEEAAAVLLQALLETMSERGFVETKVSNSEQQRAFIESFSSLSVKKIEKENGATARAQGDLSPRDSTQEKGASGSSPKGNAAVGGSASVPEATGGRGGVTRSKPVKIRKKLAKAGLRISNQPLNKFYTELRFLDVEKNPHIASGVIRIFVEKSSALFLDVMKVPTLNKAPGATWHDYGVKFKDKVDGVLKVIDPSKKNSELGYVRDVANGDRDKVHTADHLNKAIHSHLALPSHVEIITIWDRFHPYLHELFEAIENKAKP